MLLLYSVMVDVDADVGVCTTECCTVAGVELSSAPRRPINFKTLLKKMDFVPYGENRDSDAQRLAYYKQVRGYIKARVEPAIEAVRASSEEFPEHLKKVSGSLSVHVDSLFSVISWPWAPKHLSQLPVMLLSHQSGCYG